MKVSVVKLAQRLEAVRRVIANPAPWVRRLARKLQRLPKLAIKLAQPPQRQWRSLCGSMLPDVMEMVPHHVRE